MNFPDSRGVLSESFVQLRVRKIEDRVELMHRYICRCRIYEIEVRFPGYEFSSSTVQRKLVKCQNKRLECRVRLGTCVRAINCQQRYNEVRDSQSMKYLNGASVFELG